MGGKAKRTRASGVAPTDWSGPSRFGLHVRGEGPPLVARLHHRDDVYHDPITAAAEVGAACMAVPSSVRLLVAGGAFGWAELSARTQSRIPSPGEFEGCIDAAQEWIARFSVAIGDLLTVGAVFGLDVDASSHRSAPLPVAQFVVHVQPGGAGQIIAAKRFPTDREARFVYCNAKEHKLPVIMPTPLGRTLALGCHEGTVLSPRGVSRENQGEWRSQRRAEVIGDIGRADAVVNAIHSLPSERTFAMSYNSARKQRPDLKILGAFGSKCGVDGDMAIEMARRLTCPSSLPTAELVPLSWT